MPSHVRDAAVSPMGNHLCQDVRHGQAETGTPKQQAAADARPVPSTDAIVSYSSSPANPAQHVSQAETTAPVTPMGPAKSNTAKDAAPALRSGTGAGGRVVVVDAAAMVPTEEVPVQDVVQELEEPVLASPLLVAPGTAMDKAVNNLLAWQEQQGLFPPGSQGAAHGKVLRFDPAIGLQGAFYFADVPEDTSPDSAGVCAQFLQQAEAEMLALRSSGVSPGQSGDASVLPDPGFSSVGHGGAGDAADRRTSAYEKMKKEHMASFMRDAAASFEDGALTELTETLSDLDSELTVGSLSDTPCKGAAMQHPCKALPTMLPPVHELMGWPREAAEAHIGSADKGCQEQLVSSGPAPPQFSTAPAPRVNQPGATGSDAYVAPQDVGRQADSASLRRGGAGAAARAMLQQSLAAVRSQATGQTSGKDPLTHRPPPKAAPVAAMYPHVPAAPAAPKEPIELQPPNQDSDKTAQGHLRPFEVQSRLMVMPASSNDSSSLQVSPMPDGLTGGDGKATMAARHSLIDDASSGLAGYQTAATAHPVGPAAAPGMHQVNQGSAPAQPFQPPQALQVTMGMGRQAAGEQMLSRRVSRGQISSTLPLPSPLQQPVNIVEHNFQSSLSVEATQPSLPASTHEQHQQRNRRSGDVSFGGWASNVDRHMAANTGDGWVGYGDAGSRAVDALAGLVRLQQRQEQQGAGGGASRQGLPDFEDSLMDLLAEVRCCSPA